MSGGVLRIDRMTATLRGDAVPGTTSAERAAALHRRMAQVELERAWREADLPAGHWCLRRVNVRLAMAGPVSDTELAGRWARGVADAIRSAVAGHDPEVVHYRTLLDALADAVAGEALGRREHAWAWRQLGVAADPGPGPASIPALLERHPELALAALVAAMQRCGVSALDRALGSVGWTAVADCVWRAAGGTPTDLLSADDVPGRCPDPASEPLGGSAGAGGSGLTRCLAASRLSPGAATRLAWSVLLAVELDPLLPRRPDGLARLAAARHELDGELGRETEPGLSASRRRAGEAIRGPAQDSVPAGSSPVLDESSPGSRPSSDSRDPGSTEPDPAGFGKAADPGASASGALMPAPAPGGPEPAPAPGAPAPHAGRAAGRASTLAPAADGGPADEPDHDIAAEPDRDAWVWTGYAGLPFLLATAEPAGVPDRLAAALALSGRPLAWCLHVLGRLICDVRPDDAGLLALAASHWDAWPQVVAAAPAAPAEERELAGIAADWAQLTARLLGPDQEPPGPRAAELVGRMVRRPGSVLARPGWIEVRLPAEQVDLQVRRAGLDLDPGWVPWLGAVVRYRYV
jgi:hypothetical protein